MIGQLRDVRVRLDQTVSEFEGMRGGEPDAFDSWNSRHVMDQRSEIHHGTIRHGTGICVDVLSEKRDFTNALRAQLPDFIQYGIERPTDFVTPRIGDDAEAAVLAA